MLQAQFEARHLAALADANAIEWVKRIRSIALFSGPQWLDVLMRCLALVEEDTNEPSDALQACMREQQFPWCYDGPGSYADANQFFVQFHGLVEYDSIETFHSLQGRPEVPRAPVDVPTVQMRASTQELVPYVPLSLGVLQMVFDWTAVRTKLLYERIRSAFRTDHKGRLAHLYVAANPQDKAQCAARAIYQQRFRMHLSVKVGFVPLLALQQLVRTYEDEGVADADPDGITNCDAEAAAHA